MVNTPVSEMMNASLNALFLSFIYASIYFMNGEWYHTYN